MNRLFLSIQFNFNHPYNLILNVRSGKCNCRYSAYQTERGGTEQAQHNKQPLNSPNKRSPQERRYNLFV